MASFIYIPAKVGFANGSIDWDTHDIRILLVMTNSTADTETDKTTISGFTTLDECDGSAYVRKAFTGEVVNQDTPNARAELDADDVVWTALGNGTRQVQGAVIFRFITNDADSIPIAYIDFGANLNPAGGNVTIQWNAEGILQVA